MELVCQKYQQEMQDDGACCRHPQDYCKFRSGCLIQFMSKENRTKTKAPPDATANGVESDG